ncbi:MAG: hypothetical protein M0P94_05250 [Candidatus Absconditabacterales bacterium]|nr:hypothetical protein [Candidatus Absconditabacterales bacterium]
MINREFIEKIEEMSKPNFTEINGAFYSDKPLNRIEIPKIMPFERGKTLNSIVDYCNQKIDKIGEIVIHVSDYRTVTVYAGLDKDNKRSVLLQVKAPESYLEDYVGIRLDSETFNTFLQTNFVITENLLNLLSITSHLATNNSIKTSDDGMSQTAVVETSVVSKEKKEIKNPITLRPYRTFAEIEQPDSMFILRLHEGNQCKLEFVKNDYWQIDAITKIKEYLNKKIIENKVSIIG